MEQILLERYGYSDRINRMLGRGILVALTGQRRVGKSCAMRNVMANLKNDDHNNIIYIDKERTEFDDIGTYKDLETYVKNHLVADKSNYLFIDEVQEIDKFEKTILDLQSDGACEIMVTGSNAKMLSGELATLLRGRYIDYRIRGLNYLEFLQFHQFVFNTIVLRDIIERENIRNIPLLRTLIKFLSDNIGKQFSARSISKFLKSQNTEASTNIILSYLDCLCNAYIIDRVERYNIHGKKILEFDDKFFFEDMGIRNIIAGGNRSFDIEKVMENIVYKHLVRLGYTVYVGQLQKAEIDFVAENTEGTVYFQVTYLLASEETVNREFGNLMSIRDNHPKYVISMDRVFSQTNIDGIKHMHLREFLKRDSF